MLAFESGTENSLGSLAVLILDGNTATADAKMKKALGPLAVSIIDDCTATADDRT